MAATYNEGQCTIWKNEFRTEDNKQPEYRGGAMYNGEILDIALWVKEAANGRKFMNGTIKPVRIEATQPPKKDDPKDDLPF